MADLAEQRSLAIGVLLELAQDTGNDPEDRMAAACAVVDATASPTQRDQDEALRVVGDQVAERVLEHLTSAGVAQ